MPEIPVMSPLRAVSIASNFELSERSWKRPRHLLIPLILFLILETASTLAGFVLAFDQIDRVGKHIGFTWNEYLIQSAIGFMTIPTSLFDLVIMSIFKTFLVTVLCLIFRFNYKSRRRYVNRSLIYGTLFVFCLWTTRKLFQIHSVGTEHAALPVPYTWAYNMSSIVLVVTVTQLAIALGFLKTWIDRLDADLRDGYPATPRFRPNEESLQIEHIQFARLFSLIIPDIGILTFGVLNLGLNSATQLAVPYYFGKVVDSVSNHSTDPDALFRVVVTLLSIFVAGGVTGYLRYIFLTFQFKDRMHLRCQDIES